MPASWETVVWVELEAVSIEGGMPKAGNEGSQVQLCLHDLHTLDQPIACHLGPTCQVFSNK